MIDLSAYPKFKQDSEQSHVTIYPLVIIDNEYYMSTVKEVIVEAEGGETLNFKDYNLKISNIKESTDIENRNFKINNVTLNLNNYEIDGQRLSDVLVFKINKDVEIYYKTQSCQYLSDCLPVYKGSLRKIDHDSSNVKITLEDLTQSRFHKDVPIANLGFSDHVLDKDYFNRPIPITYGYVDKAPAIPYKESTGFMGDTNIYLITDDISDVTGNSRNIEIQGFGVKGDIFIPEECRLVEESEHGNPLHIYKGDYYRVLEEFNTDVSDSDYLDEHLQQYEVDPSLNFLKIEKIFEGQTPKNPPAFNEFQTVKARFPNEFNLLKSNPNDNNGYIYDDEGYQILNLNYPVYGGENSLISPEHPSLLNSEHPFLSFTEIPNSQIVEAPDEISVGGFRNYKEGRHGIFYPEADKVYGVLHMAEEGMNCTSLIGAWVQTNAHRLDVTFIDAPPADMIQKRVYDRLVDEGMFSSDGTDTIAPLKNRCLIQPQSCITPNSKGQWAAESGIDINEVAPNYPSHHYYSEDYKYQKHEEQLYDENGDEGGTATHIVNNFELFDGTFNSDTNKKAVFPQTMWLFEVDTNSELNIWGINYVLVGMENDSVSGYGNSYYYSGSSGDTVWHMNLFPKEGDSQPYLFDLHEFATFKPYELVHKSNFNHSRNIGCKFNSYWNGVAPGTMPYDNYKSVNCIPSNLNKQFNGGHPGRAYAIGTDSIKSKKISGWSDTETNTGSSGWLMMANEDITNPLAKLFDENSEENKGEYTNNNMNCVIKKGTLIPCISRVKPGDQSDDDNDSGTELGFEFTIPTDPNYFTVSPIIDGNDGIAEQRLSALFPIPSADVEDEIFTDTFIYGKILVNLPGNSPDPTLNDVNSDSRFVVGVGAADISLNDDGENSFIESELPVHGKNIIDIQEGGDSGITSSKDINWTIRDNDDLEGGLNAFADITQARLEDWVTPNEFDALTLSFRILSSDASNYASAKANIYNLGLLQFITFENALKSPFYIDTIGRADTPEENFKYTNSESEFKTVIQNPADILYHFVEKELGYTNVIDTDSWTNAKDLHEGFDLAFSIKDVINSKKLIEDISKNTFLFPKFTVEGGFGFDVIKETYQDSDVSSTIGVKDVINISFSRTPIENINTLVNVKYRKDYAEDEYTRQTGYCDAYDFFGNGDGYGGGLLEILEYEGQSYDESIGLVGGYKYLYYGLEREDKILEFESDYIRDNNTAIKLRDFLLKHNANQHNIVNCTLTLKNINLETGDIIKFEELIDGLKCYGEDYTEPTTRNGQGIYPYFMITSITKSAKNIKISALQLHSLTPSFTATQGSLTRMSATDAINFEDANILNKYILGQYPYMTQNQIRLSELSMPTSGTVIDYVDLDVLLSYLFVMGALGFTISFDDFGNEFIEFGTNEEVDPITDDEEIIQGAGDINSDGIINVVDIVALVGYIIGEGELSEEALLQADFNGDGIINVVDIVAIVSLILE